MEQLTVNEAQDQIINSVLFGSEIEIDKIRSLIKPDHLQGKARKVYDELLKIDCKDKTERFNILSKNLSSKTELFDYIYSIDTSTTVLNGHVEFILERYNQKQLTAQLKNIVNSTDASDLKADQLFKLSQEYQKIKVDTVVVDSKAIYHNILEDMEFKGDMVGHSWGIQRLNRQTGGIERQKTYVLGALKKAGKTRFMVNSIYSLFSQNKTSLIFSLEMSARALQQFIICRFAGVSTDIFKIKNRTYEKDKSQIAKNVPLLANGTDLIKIIDEPGLSVHDIISKIRKTRSMGIDVVFIDYIQRMNLPDENRAFGLQDVTAKLADCAREENISIVFLSQLANRAENRIATIADLKESGGIAENVDCAIILNNMDRIQGTYEQDKKTNSIMAIVEQRSGESGSIKLQAKLETCEFREEQNV